MKATIYVYTERNHANTIKYRVYKKVDHIWKWRNDSCTYIKVLLFYQLKFLKNFHYRYYVLTICNSQQQFYLYGSYIIVVSIQFSHILRSLINVFYFWEKI